MVGPDGVRLWWYGEEKDSWVNRQVQEGSLRRSEKGVVYPSGFVIPNRCSRCSRVYSLAKSGDICMHCREEIL